MATPYLVFFSADPVDDARAEAILARARALAGERSWAGAAPGWFDDPGAESDAARTTGCYLRVDDLEDPDALAMLDAARALSAELGMAVEVQWREDVVARFGA